MPTQLRSGQTAGESSRSPGTVGPTLESRAAFHSLLDVASIHFAVVDGNAVRDCQQNPRDLLEHGARVAASLTLHKESLPLFRERACAVAGYDGGTLEQGRKHDRPPLRKKASPAISVDPLEGETATV